MEGGPRLTRRQVQIAQTANPLLTQSAGGQLQNAANELVIEGEYYRRRQKPLTSLLPESEPVRTRQRPTG
jgi:hypothetical protein